MIRSMTGFGTAEGVLADGRVLRVEIRTVNHRHLNANIRTPHGWDVLEKPVGDRIRDRLSRGHVSLSLTVEGAGAGDRAFPEVDLERARHYQESLSRVQEALGLGGTLDVNTVARLPDVFRPAEAPSGPPDADEVGPLVDEALNRVVELREREGERLGAELIRCLDRIEDELAEVEARAPGRLVRERDRLREHVRTLSESVEVDEDRLAREIAYLAEKWDIQEELVRFRSHVALFRETLSPEHDERAGKRLGFVVQEMNREANTIGSKANDPDIGAGAVAIKEQLEQLREQIENVE